MSKTIIDEIKLQREFEFDKKIDYGGSVVWFLIFLGSVYGTTVGYMEIYYPLVFFSVFIMFYNSYLITKREEKVFLLFRRYKDEK